MMIQGHVANAGARASTLKSSDRPELRWPDMRKKNIYLREGKEFIGPFQSLKDAQRFLQLMKGLHQKCNGIEIVMEQAPLIQDTGEVTLDERRCLHSPHQGPEYPIAHLEHAGGNNGDKPNARPVKKGRRIKRDGKER